MAIVTGDRYLESLVKFVEENTGPLIDGTLVLKLNPVGLHYVVSRLEALNELERLIARAPVDYLRAYVFDLGDHRALEQLRRILCRLTSLKVVSVLPPPTRDPTPLSLLPFGRLRVLELRGCDLSTSAAKGLLELRLCLEKIICHNSTDALRHVFASRIADIKKSHQWSRLSFVSCACNGLILMDESLQLLPALETLDLSRNKFSKVDNLRKCSKLAHLDLGFNQLRSIASLSEVASHIRKLVLRNNALTTLRGIENLKTIEGLDLSYNIISSFSELEVLSSLPSLKNLWLEGNPLFSARWYRPQVFSFFAHPHQLKLDNKEISTREFWKRGIIIARKLKRPASYGFYFPARENTEEDGFPNTKRKKLSRLACIESEECDVNILSEHDSVTCDYEVPSGDEIVASDEESEITSLINKIELMKKERSKLWLQDFKNWTDQGSFVNVVDGSKQQGWELCHRGEKYLANKSSWRHIGESANYAPDSIKADNDEWSTTGLASNSSFAETTLEFRQGAIPEESQFASTNLPLNHDYSKLYLERGEYNTMIAGKSNNRILTVPRGDDASTSVDMTASVVNIDTVEALLFSAFPVSPPHYQEDILHRRHYLEEEFLQLSAESLSLASSDSNTSMEEDKVCETETLQVDKSFNGESLSNGISWCSASASAEDGDDVMDEVHHVTQICQLSHELYAGQAKTELIIPGQSSGLCYDDDVCVGVGNDNNYSAFVKQRRDGLNMNKCIRKPKKRVVSLSDENSMSSLNQIVNELEPLQHSKVNTVFSGEDRKAEEKEHTVDKNDSFRKECDNTDTPSVMMLPPMDENGRSLVPGNDSAQQPGSWVENYFNSVVADPRVHETCRQYFICSSFFDHEMRCEEREVAVLVSSESKLYVLLTDIRVNGSG